MQLESKRSKLDALLATAGRNLLRNVRSGFLSLDLGRPTAWETAFNVRLTRTPHTCSNAALALQTSAAGLQQTPASATAG